MAALTTEQYLPFTFQVVDGRGRPVAVEGSPVAASSDETVGTVELAAGSGTAWDGKVNSVAVGTARVTVTADADLGAGIQEVVGILDFEVTLDPRTGARMVTMEPGTPVDKPVT